MALRIGVDIGGTFTDLTVVDDGGRTLLVWKEDTTHGRYAAAIRTGLRAIAAALGRSLQELLADVGVFVHGSTIATNMLIERNGPPVGLVATEGFRDVLYFRDAFKADRYNIHLRRPAPVVDRHLRIGVRERVLRDGTVETALDEGSVRAAGATLREAGVEAVAVALLWAHVNPTHERRVRALLAEELPAVPILLSSDVLPEHGEWVRTSATALSAYVYPATATYLRELESWLAEEGLRSDLLVMQINGGCANVEQCLKVPVALTHSGPAAAPVAARHTARRVAQALAREVITIDMGGTSFDVTLMQRGRVPLARGLEIDHQPIGVPGVDLHSIGSGGGSLAWVDSGGALRVEARLGRLDARPGRLRQRRHASDGDRRQPRARLPAGGAARRPQGALAEAVGRGAGARRRGAARVVGDAGRVRRAARRRGGHGGRDARRLGRARDRPARLPARRRRRRRPLHAARLARHLEMRQVLLPAEAGGLSSFGMTVTDVRHDYSFALHTTTGGFLRADVEAGGRGAGGSGARRPARAPCCPRCRRRCAPPRTRPPPTPRTRPGTPFFPSMPCG